MGPRDVTVSNPNGQSAVSPGGFTVASPPATISLAFLGKLRDKVGKAAAAFSADGALDGSFRVTVEPGSGARTVTRLELRHPASGGAWDTDSASPSWALGTAASLDGALLNAGNGAVNFTVADGSVFFLFASEFSAVFAQPGASFSVTATFADGTSASATVILSIIPTISSVSPSLAVQGASLTVTVTGTNCQAGASASFGPGITVSSTTVVSSTQLSVTLAIGATATMGPRDVTVSNPNSQSAVRPGGFTVASPPATIKIGRASCRESVYISAAAEFSEDRAVSGSFRVTVQPESTARP